MTVNASSLPVEPAGVTDALPPVSHVRVIGLGASAGGLEALKKFFDHVPPDCPHSFVIVQHLSPDYESMMAELLARNTKLPIHEVENNMPVESGAIYLIPPGKVMRIRDQTLRLTDKPAGHDVHNLPIDIFLRSLADEQAERAVAVILSGTGSDGTRGLRAIKEAGGLVLVQSPETAKFDGMPNSAIATGLIDAVLPVEHLAGELMRLISPQNEPGTKEREVLTDEETQRQILALVRRSTDLDFSFYKRPTLARRLVRRMNVCRCSTIKGYLDYVTVNPEEAQALADDFLIGVTQMFRDPHVWQALADRILPALVDAKEDGETIKIWSVGCSSGEEAYTLAILLKEVIDSRNRRLDVKIFATDIDKDALEIATRGLYPESVLESVPPDRRRTYFSQMGDRVQVSQEIRRMIIFSQHNILLDPPFGKIDLVTCRNLLIYLQLPMQQKVMSILRYALNVGGTLVLGSSESLGDFRDAFEELDRKCKIFRNLSRPKFINMHTGDASFLASQGVTSAGNSAAEAQRQKTETRMAGLLNESLLDEFNGAAVYIDENFDILNAIGSYKDFLSLPEHKLRLNLMEMVPKELSITLSIAVRKAEKEQRKVSYPGLQLEQGEQVRLIDMTVQPFELPTSARSHYLVVLLEKSVETPSVPQSQLPAFPDSSTRIQDLEEQLRHTRENLQTTVEEVETSNEELQATNEELLAANEELQSTNEELQSVNEELHTVNAEYRLKIDELAELNADMDNLLESTEIATIFLDRNLRIRKFTPAISALFSLVASDVGRPIEHFTSKLEDSSHNSIATLAEQVLISRTPHERKVRSVNGRWYLERLSPFRREGEVQGVVATFVDVTELVETQRDLDYSEAKLRSILEQSEVYITMLGLDGEVLYANRTDTEIPVDEYTGMNIFEVYSDEITERVRDAMQQVIASRAPVRYRTAIQGAAGETYTYRHVASPFLQNGEVQAVTYLSFDISAEEKMRAELQDKAEELARSNAELEQFGYAASHDLKEPLNTIRNFIGLIQRRHAAELSSDAQDLMQYVIDASVRMESLIRALLDYSHLQKAQLSLEEVELPLILDGVVADLRVQIDECDGTVDVAELPTICGHGEMMRQLFQNLISNALRYCAPDTKPHVRVWCESGEDAWTFFVADNGIGIEEKYFEQIFGIFRRLHTRGEFEGTGVGLSICRKIVELHEGEIGLTSQLGEGSTFRFTIGRHLTQEQKS